MHNSSRFHLRRENAAFAATVPPGAVVLDAGAGEQPYRDLFAHCRYEAADFERVDKPYARSTYVCDLASIPVEDGRFDAVVCNQVLEHLPEPASVLAELHRVLKPGGRMICTAPLFYEEHERPFDFYRYTQFGWRHLLQKAGFEVERLDWMEGYFGTVAYQLETASAYLPKAPRRYAPGLKGFATGAAVAAARPFFRILADMLYSADEAAKFTAAGFPKNYVVVARKPTPRLAS